MTATPAVMAYAIYIRDTAPAQALSVDNFNKANQLIGRLVGAGVWEDSTLICYPYLGDTLHATALLTDARRLTCATAVGTIIYHPGAISRTGASWVATGYTLPTTKTPMRVCEIVLNNIANPSGTVPISVGASDPVEGAYWYTSWLATPHTLRTAIYSSGSVVSYSAALGSRAIWQSNLKFEGLGGQNIYRDGTLISTISKTLLDHTPGEAYVGRGHSTSPIFVYSTLITAATIVGLGVSDSAARQEYLGLQGLGKL